MAHPNMFPLESSYFILFDASTINTLKFIGVYPVLSEAAQAAEEFLNINRQTNLIVFEAEYGLMRKITFEDVAPVFTMPEDPN